MVGWILREAVAARGTPAVAFGLTCGLGIAGPLFVGILTGHVGESATVAFAAFLVAFAGAEGPYASRARALTRSTMFVTAGVAVGGLVTGLPWLALVVAATAAAASQWIGVSAVIALVINAVEPREPGHVLFTLLGGLGMTGLMLAPWPVRRLRPLQESLAAAGTAVADMLAAAPQDWATSRKEAGAALSEARAACALYRGARRDERTPERLVDAYRRAFREGVAVQGLRAAAGRQDDLDEAVAALAVALREVAAGSVVAVPPALAKAAAFGEQVRTTGDPAELAVLGQIRRCLHRLAVAVRSSALIVIEGVRLPPRLSVPRLPDLPGRDERRRAARYGGRMAVAVAIAMALVLSFHPDHGHWLVITALLSLRPTYGDTVGRVVLRIAGTAIGATLAAAVLVLAPGYWALAIVVLFCATLGFALRGVSYVHYSLFATPLALVLSDFGADIGWEAALVRIALTIVGGLLALVCARLLWPREEEARLPDLAGDLLAEHAELVRALADGKALDDRQAEAARTAGRLNEALERLEKEPRSRPDPHLWDADGFARRVRDDVTTLAAVLRVSPGDEEAPTAAILDAIADRMDAVADAVQTGKPAPPADALDDALDDLADHVDDLAERIDDHPAGDDQPATLRRALLHAAAAYPALQALDADAVRLTRALSRLAQCPRP